MKTNTINNLLLVMFFCSYAHVVHSESVAPPQNPAQSIVYWKPHTISPQQDSQVALAHTIFDNLLRAWDSSRLEPSLHVVNSTSGPWAASLADGNILLSKDAIEICVKFGIDRAQHLLAFVLSHELAHQRADDLWHQKFFRLIGNQSPELRSQLIGKLELDSSTITAIEEKEAQADHDGLITMASVGYDPHQIVNDKDFFTAWVENIWQNSCADTQASDFANSACRQAQSRALRTTSQLSDVALQATLYELGSQAFISGNFTSARQYFTAFGRDYPSRAVYSSLGMTYLAQSLTIQRQIDQLMTPRSVKFYYPMLLDASPQAEPTAVIDSTAQKRGINSQKLKKLKRTRNSNIDKSIDYFEKAIRLEPDHRKSYLFLAIAYLVNENTFMARGVIQGKYIPEFKKDNASALIMAMTSALEGNRKQSAKEFRNLAKFMDKNSTTKDALPNDLLIYTFYHNNAALYEAMGKSAKSKELWQKLANDAQQRGSSVLFRLALQHLNAGEQFSRKLSSHPQISKLRLGDSVPKNIKKLAVSRNEIWLEGEQLQFYRLKDGSNIIVDTGGSVVNFWQSSGSEANLGDIFLGDDADRPIKSMGLPTRHLNITSGEYLAYDDYGIAFHVMHNKIAGWFLY